jgi:hypothetical protein
MFETYVSTEPISSLCLVQGWKGIIAQTTAVTVRSHTGSNEVNRFRSGHHNQQRVYVFEVSQFSYSGYNTPSLEYMLFH